MTGENDMNQKNHTYTIHVCEPDISGKEIQYVTDAIKTGNISSTAKYVGLFENAFAKKIGVKHAVAVNSGGSALFLTLWALGIRKGDEVIVPTFTMVATANAVIQCGAKPVFVDCEENGNIDTRLVEKKITNRTKAIIPVHVYGHPCDVDEIRALAKKYRIFILEDAAEAHGALYKNKMVGSLGDAACFSFYANKLITAGEGGMVTTNNSKLADALYKLRGYYFSEKMHFWHKKLAWNMRLGSLQAALGLAQLERLDELVAKRRANAAYYTKGLTPLEKYLTFPNEKENARSVFWMYGIVLKKMGKRNALMRFLAEHGIETRTFFFPMHWQPIYKENGAYPVADRLGRSGLYLPSSSHLSKKDKDRVIGVITEFFNK